MVIADMLLLNSRDDSKKFEFLIIKNKAIESILP